MKFSTALMKKYSRSDGYVLLLKLHEVWYKIKGLESKNSAYAEKMMQSYKADFYSLADKVGSLISDKFNSWIDFHEDYWVDYSEQSPEEETVFDENNEQQLLTDPEFGEIMEKVKKHIKKLKSLDLSNIDETMKTISLALNEAHGNGLMFQYVLSESEMNELSNLDTSKWDEQLSKVASNEI